MKKPMILILVSAALFTACKKDDAVAETETTAKKVLGKWAFVTQISSETYLGVTTKDTTVNTAADYADFRSDNKVYISLDSELDTSVYKIISDKALVIDGDTAEIKTLTSNAFVLLNTEDFAGVHSEITISFKK